MNLLVPLALVGLITLPAIILLHFLRNRREQLPIPSLRLWRGLHQRKHGALPRNIPLSLMLILQLLIAAALTLGLAQPVFSILRTRPHHTIFVLDTTTSMTAEDVTPGSVVEAAVPSSNRRFDSARQIIHTHFQNMDDDDTVVVISLNRQPEVLLSGNGRQKARARLALDDLSPGNTGENLPAALTMANGLIEPEQITQIVVLTDDTFNVDPQTLPQMSAPVEWQPIGTDLLKPSNQALLNVSSQTLPDGRHRLFARIINYGEEPVERTMLVATDGRRFDRLRVQLGAQTEAARVWTLPASVRTAAVEIIEPDILPLDNRAELFLGSTSHYQVLLISGKTEPQNGALVRALQAQPGVDLRIEAAANWKNVAIGDFALVVFDGLPLDLISWPKGNLLVLNPPLGHPLLPAQNFARNLRPDPETASALLTGIDLSGVYFNRLPHLVVPDWADVDLVAFAPADSSGLGANRNEQHPLIFHGSVGGSRVVVWAFNLDESNLPARLALPLLTGNTLSTVVSTLPPAVVPLGEPVMMASDLSIELPDGRRLSPSFQPDVGQLNRFSRTKQTGLYKIHRSGEQVGGFAVHAGSALESNITTRFDPNDLGRVENKRAAAFSSDVEYFEYWPWLAGLALVIITIEGWLAWRK